MKSDGFTIKNVRITPPWILAPMAGITHLPFRRLVRSFSPPGLVFTEMLSARTLPAEQFEQRGFIQCDEDEHPISYQIFAATPEDAARATEKLSKGPADIVDLNLSCPAPEIARKRKAGAHLLHNLPLIHRILCEMIAVSEVPVTVKIRLGEKPDKKFLADLASVLNEIDVAAVTIHPRVTGEKLKRLSRWEYIGYLKDLVRVPVIGNGDVENRADCLKMMRETGCDGVMIGRSAVQKPWIFSEIEGKSPEITPEFLLKTYRVAIREFSGYFEETKCLGRIKAFTWYYAKNMKFGHHFAALIQNSGTIEELAQITEKNFSGCC